MPPHLFMNLLAFKDQKVNPVNVLTVKYIITAWMKTLPWNKYQHPGSCCFFFLPISSKQAGGLAKATVGLVVVRLPRRHPGSGILSNCACSAKTGH